MEARSDEEQDKIQQFMEVVRGSANEARQFLQATGWDLHEAIQLYFVGGGEAIAGVTATPTPSVPSTSVAELSPQRDIAPVPVVRAESPKEPVGDNYVRSPIPVKREALNEGGSHFRAYRMAQTPNQPTPVDAFRDFQDEANQRATWAMEPSNGSSTGLGGTKQSLAALYRPPLELRFQGNFEQAKAEATRQGKWLLVNVQATKEFSSHMLNRDTWSHEAVKDTVSMSFVFWQMDDDTEDGQKVCTYYNLNVMPTTLVLDPLTGLKMRAWEGMILPDRLLEDLVPYLDRGPMERHPPLKRPCASSIKTAKTTRDAEIGKAAEIDEQEALRLALAASLEDSSASVSDGKESNRQAKVEGDPVKLGEQPLKEVPVNRPPTFPTLPEEPAVNNTASCKIAVRLPDGRKPQRRFLQSDPIQVPEAADGKSFRLSQAIPGASPFDYSDVKSIFEAGLSNSVIAMTWE